MKKTSSVKRRTIPVVFLLGILLFPSVLQAEVLAAKGQVLPEVKTYDDLVSAIRGARKESRARVEKAVAQERVREAWEIGKLIDEHVLQHKERAEYGKQVLLRLSKDLGMSDTELRYMLQFARGYSICPLAGNLTWSDYRELLSVDDAQERQVLADRAEKEDWSRDRLRVEIQAVTGKERRAGLDAPDTLPPPQMGQAGTYKIILAKPGPHQGDLALDLGFSNYFRLSEVLGEDLSAVKEGDIVSFSGKTYQVLGETGASNVGALLYTYKAWVSRVLDGDTIKAVVDLGFGITTTQTLRLRGIDAPEILTQAGREAKQFVDGFLPPGMPIFIRTTKSDKYDRYLVDVFVTDPASGEDKFLNNLLLEQGHAVRAGG